MKDWRGKELVIRDPTAMFIRGEQYSLPHTVRTEQLTNRQQVAGILRLACGRPKSSEIPAKKKAKQASSEEPVVESIER